MRKQKIKSLIKYNPKRNFTIALQYLKNGPNIRNFYNALQYIFNGPHHYQIGEPIILPGFQVKSLMRSGNLIKQLLTRKEMDGLK